MSRQSVRLAVAAFLQPPAVAGLGHVYTALPREFDPTLMYAALPPGTPSGASAFPFVATQHEQRRGLGMKQVVYEVTLTVVFASQQPRAEDAQDDLDAILEALIDRVRSDPTLGTGGNPVFQSGEGTSLGGSDIAVTQELPVEEDEGGTLVCWPRAVITTLELIQNTII